MIVGRVGKNIKPYGSDGMNNFGNNTRPNSSQTRGKYPEILEYWNFFLSDE